MGAGQGLRRYQRVEARRQPGKAIVESKIGQTFYARHAVEHRSRYQPVPATGISGSRGLPPNPVSWRGSGDRCAMILTSGTAALVLCEAKSCRRPR